MPVNTSRFLHGGVGLVLIGYYFTYKFGTLPEEDITSNLTGCGFAYGELFALPQPIGAVDLMTLVCGAKGASAAPVPLPGQPPPPLH